MTRAGEGHRGLGRASGIMNIFLTMVVLAL